MHHFIYSELPDIHLVYGAANGNGSAAQDFTEKNSDKKTAESTNV